MAGLGTFLTSKAGGGVVGYLTKGIGSKLIAFVVLVFVFKAAFTLIGELLPDLHFDTMFDGVPGAVIWGINYFDGAFFLNTILPAYALAFFIKRLPVVG